jgi:NADPH2:quinone reductase
VDGKKQDIKAAALAFAPDGLDAVLGLAGGEALEHCCAAISRGGRFAYPNGVEPVPKKRRGIHTVAYDAVPGVREFARLGHAVDDMRLQVPIAGVFDLAHSAQAHERIERGHVLGKIVLRIR